MTKPAIYVCQDCGFKIAIPPSFLLTGARYHCMKCGGTFWEPKEPPKPIRATGRGRNVVSLRSHRHSRRTRVPRHGGQDRHE